MLKNVEIAMLKNVEIVMLKNVEKCWNYYVGKCRKYYVEKCRKNVLGNVLKIPQKFLRLRDFLWGYSLSESKKYTLDLEPFGSGKWEANHLKWIQPWYRLCLHGS